MTTAMREKSIAAVCLKALIMAAVVLALAVTMAPKAAYATEGTFGNNCKYTLGDDKNLVIMKENENLDASFAVTPFKTKFEQNEGLDAWKNITSFSIKDGDSIKVLAGDVGLSEMFYGCTSLETVDLNGLYLASNVLHMRDMFESCSSLQAVDFGELDTSKIVTMHAMFRYCANLTEIKGLANFKTSSVTLFSDMFTNCSSLTSLDLSAFDTSRAEDMSGMFGGCTKLSTVKLGSKFTFLTGTTLPDNDNTLWKNSDGYGYTALQIALHPTECGAPGEFVRVTTYSVDGSIQNGTLMGATEVDPGTEYTGTIVPDAGYSLPESIMLKMGGDEMTAGGVDYTYDAATGAITIPSEKVHGDIKISATCTLQQTYAYTILEGQNASHEIGSDQTITVRIDGPANELKAVNVDGKLVDPSSYSVESGSTVVTFKADYLNTLSAGEHQAQYVFENGVAESKFTITAKEGAGTDGDEAGALAETGDVAPVVPLALAVAISGAAAFGLGLRRKAEEGR